MTRLQWIRTNLLLCFVTLACTLNLFFENSKETWITHLVVACIGWFVILVRLIPNSNFARHDGNSMVEIISEKFTGRVGATFILVQCNGCMAQDHVVKYIGEIVGSKKVNGYDYHVIRIIKRDNKDCRDVDLGFTEEPAWECQRMTNNLYIRFN